MCPSHCNMSVNAYGMSLLESWAEWGDWLSKWRYGVLAEMKFLLNWAKQRRRAMGKMWPWPCCCPTYVHVRSFQGTSSAPGPPTLCTAWGDIKQRCWHSLEPCLHPPHPACHPPALPACWGSSRRRGEAGGSRQKGKHTAESSSLSVVAAGPVGCLIFETWLDNPGASAGLSQIISQSLPQLCRTGSLPHFVTVLEGIHVVLQGTLRMASIINNHYDFFLSDSEVLLVIMDYLFPVVLIAPVLYHQPSSAYLSGWHLFSYAMPPVRPQVSWSVWSTDIFSVLHIVDVAIVLWLQKVQPHP